MVFEQNLFASLTDPNSDGIESAKFYDYQNEQWKEVLNEADV